MIEINYSARLAIDYARKYAQAPQHMRVFYTAPDDCTNFVSQCIWAGYGGWSPDLMVTRERIRLRYRMARGVWHGDDGGGTPAWETVDGLFRFCTRTGHSVGPRAAQQNDGGVYTALPTDDIELGDVLQFRQGLQGRYHHSVIVSGRRETSMISGYSPYDGILVCQHSRDLCDRNLWDLIVYFGGPDCRMRLMKFGTGEFVS